MTVFEFDRISVGSDENHLSKADFKELKSFILPHKDNESGDEGQEENGVITDASVCLTLGAYCGEEVIRVKNYVGIVSLKSGTTIEILPKIAKGATSEETARRLVVEMLKACDKITYKSFQNAQLNYKRMNLFEVYIRLFLNELNELYKKGLKAGYVPHSENENFLKGKLVFGEHIKRNYAHREKFYVEYDEFSFDRAENRLIKSTLLYLRNKAREENNRSDLRRMLLIFEEITPSQNYDADFARCITDRTVKEYANLLQLCKVFLHNHSFTVYGGNNRATALLFPMDKLFEAFIADKMSSAAIAHGYRLKKQDRGKYLFGKDEDGKFPLRPDIVLYPGNAEDPIIIVDTKWKKLIDNADCNYGISQADMYQMYAYHTRYDNVKKVVLLYPHYEDVQIRDYKTQVGCGGVLIQVRTFDLRRYFENGVSFEECILHDNCIFI